MSKQELSDFNKKLKIAMNINSKPYISITKLAEYMQANAKRRKSIVRSLKGDKDFMKKRYQPVRSVIPKFFKSGYDTKIIDRLIDKTQNEYANTTWVENDQTNTILALKSLKDSQLPDLSDYDFINDAEKIQSINLSGVEVSIKPELYLRNKFSNKIGALKIHIAKTPDNRLDEISRQYAATIIRYGFIEHEYKVNEIDNNACICLDIFKMNYSTAPVAYVRSIDALSAACEEISLRWDSI